MTRPGEARARGHVTHEFGFALEHVGEAGLAGSAAIVPELHVPDTTVLRASVLATWADLLTGMLAVRVLAPRVPVTLQLDVHLIRPPSGVARVEGTSRLVKAGAAVVVAAADFCDETGERFATSTGVFMAAPDPNVTMPDDFDVFAMLHERGGPLARPLAERAGCERRAPGLAVLPRSDDGLNASGTVNGGLLALVAEEAALSCFPGTTLAMMAMCFLRPVRIGPAVARAVARGNLAEVTVDDAGRGDAHALSVTARAF